MGTSPYSPAAMKSRPMHSFSCCAQGMPFLTSLAEADCAPGPGRDDWQLTTEGPAWARGPPPHPRVAPHVWSVRCIISTASITPGPSLKYIARSFVTSDLAVVHRRAISSMLLQLRTRGHGPETQKVDSTVGIPKPTFHPSRNSPSPRDWGLWA